MAIDYFPLLLLIIISAALAAIVIGVPPLLGPQRKNAQKMEPYESGMIPFGDTKRKFPIQYYLIAMLFIIFDIEVIFFYPWAVTLRSLRTFGLVAMGIFFLVIVIGFIYEWRKGALDWE